MVASKEAILDRLRREIITLERAPGALLDEASLCGEFDISRTPMREILRRLDGEGYVKMRENRSAIVSPMDMQSMRQFFLTAPMIYASISRLAAEHARAEQISTLEAIQGDFKKAVEMQSVESLVYFNDRFHFQIGEMADNAYLQPALQRLLIDHARIGQTFWTSQKEMQAGKVQEASNHHDQLIAAFDQHDQEKAVEITLEHWQLSRVEMDKYIHPDPLALDALLTG